MMRDTFIINMNEVEDSFKATFKALAEKVGIEFKEECFSVCDDCEFDESLENPEEAYTVQYADSENENFIEVGITKYHRQFDFNKNIMYGFYEFSSSMILVNGKQEESHFEEIRKVCELYNDMFYLKK